jgi:hypothetical protein
MYALVADYIVVFETTSCGGSYRLQKYIDISGLCEPVINVSHDTPFYDCRSLIHLINPFYVRHYKSIVKDNKLVTLETPFINNGSGCHMAKADFKEFQVTNMLILDKPLYVLPSSYTNVSQSKENRVSYEECTKNTITMAEFIDQFNNAGHNSLDKLNKTNQQIDTLQYELDKAREQMKELKEQNTLLLSSIRNAEEIESSQQTMISSLYNYLEDTKAQLNRVTDEKCHLKSEVDTLVQCMANILKDVAYLKTVSPMIDM